MSRRGFTLIELLVVIGIMGIMMLVAVPLFQRFTRAQDLKNSGRLMQSVFQQARWKALSRRESVRIVFTRAALGIYTESGGYGRDFKPVPLPKSVSYVYNFGPDPDLSPPEDFPPAEEITADKTGPGFPGKIEYRRDGTVIFGGEFQDVPRPEVDDISLFDPNRTIARRIPRETRTDIVFDRPGDTKRCYIDITPSTGRVMFKVLEAELPGAEE